MKLDLLHSYQAATPSLLNFIIILSHMQDLPDFYVKCPGVWHSSDVVFSQFLSDLIFFWTHFSWRWCITEQKWLEKKSMGHSLPRGSTCFWCWSITGRLVGFGEDHNVLDVGLYNSLCVGYTAARSWICINKALLAGAVVIQLQWCRLIKLHKTSGLGDSTQHISNHTFLNLLGLQHGE